MNCKIAGVNLGHLQVQEGCKIFELSRRVLLVKVQLCVNFTAGQSEGKRCCWSVEKITKNKRFLLKNFHAFKSRAFLHFSVEREEEWGDG